MYFAIISKRYDPATFAGAKTAMGSCFSRWFFKNDLTLKIKTVTFDKACKGNTVDGVYFYNAVTLCSYQWMQFELEEVELIKTILVMPRNPDSKFHDILIEIGRTESTMKTFDTYGPTASPKNQFVEFNGIRGPMKGKFIRISKTSDPILHIGEIAILGA